MQPCPVWGVPKHMSGCNLLILALHLTNSPHKLVKNISNLGLPITLCSGILDFLTNRPQNVRVANHASPTLTLNTGAPQGCILSPAIFTLFTHDCTPIHSSNSIVKFSDTTTVGLISGNDQKHHRGGLTPGPVVFGHQPGSEHN